MSARRSRPDTIGSEKKKAKLAAAQQSESGTQAGSSSSSLPPTSSAQPNHDQEPAAPRLVETTAPSDVDTSLIDSANIDPNSETVTDIAPVNPTISPANTAFSHPFHYPVEDAFQDWIQPLPQALPQPSSSHLPTHTVRFEDSHTSPAEEQSHGTLVISHTGSSKYLGPSAASEWLKDAEVLEGNETPGFSRAASPTVPSSVPQTRSHLGFPFSGRGASAVPSFNSLTSSLPAFEEAEALIDSYYRYFGWSYEIVSRSSVRKIIQDVFSYLEASGEEHRRSRIHVQQLGLLFIVLAMGALHNLELRPDDTSAEEYMLCAEDCLTKGHFMTNNTVAGVQTLIIMAHFHLETDKGRNGDSAWTLWGLAMRIIQAMGLHRDGEKWNLPTEVVEERRRIFWESHSAEIFQANCFSRPYAIPAEFIDTRFPADKPSVSNTSSLISYHTKKFELAQIAKSVLQTVLNTTGPAYQTITDLYETLRAFERSIPFHLRCRTALLALPSLYSDAKMAEAESPEVNKRDLRRTFEQFSLSMIVSETIVNLNRPYFMRALIECPIDPLRTMYGQAYLSVVERSNVIIQIVCGLYALHPSVAARHWWCWYHAFNSAVCLGTLILMSPQNELVPIALGAMGQAIGIYTDTVHSRAAPRLVQNLRWLLRLRQRAMDRIELSRQQPQGTQDPDSDTETDAGLLGWRTRFIERVGQGSQKATSISTRSPAATGLTPTGDIEGVIKSIPQAIQQHIASDLPELAPPTGSSSDSPPVQMNSTDQLLHQFWDPMMLTQDLNDVVGSSMSWWDVLSQPPP
uniref:Xylanolytic transcriptional activator regulatory domain-containing protein n=1 Tax=Kwoniella dejecticola CBS 10117 TaxID=1296121 RepID=A0A1A6ADS2_9TREE|nr:uncharacterized protein I303_02403 [Kwoniella dejecticola CBS 10117]OBR88183.1 hypothetical protein I303_02403 [Kwoniella dejecticola CBS 10117]